jgi:hypothetical protein
MSEVPSLLPFRLSALSVTLAGMGLVAASGARGLPAMVGFGMFCLGMAILDGLFRGRFGFRQAAIFLGSLGAGMGAWVVVATSLLDLLELPVGAELRSLLIASAVCAAGASGAAVLAVRPLRVQLLSRVRGVGRFFWGLVSRPGEPRARDLGFGAGQPFRPAGPAREG